MRNVKKWEWELSGQMLVIVHVVQVTHMHNSQMDCEMTLHTTTWSNFANAKCNKQTEEKSSIMLSFSLTEQSDYNRPHSVFDYSERQSFIERLMRASWRTFECSANRIHLIPFFIPYSIDVKCLVYTSVNAMPYNAMPVPHL